MITEAALRQAETVEVINNILEYYWQMKIRPELAEEIIESITVE
jgi:Ca2+-dependent lipid-binding protein